MKQPTPDQRVNRPRRARRHGARRDRGDALTLEAAAAPPAAVIDLLSHHKAGILAWLCAANADGSAQDWQAPFDERAGIAEFGGGMVHEEADADAFASCLVQWLDRHRLRSLPGCGPAQHKPTSWRAPMPCSKRSTATAARASRRSRWSTFTSIPAGRRWSAWWSRRGGGDGGKPPVSQAAPAPPQTATVLWPGPDIVTA